MYTHHTCYTHVAHLLVLVLIHMPLFGKADETLEINPYFCRTHNTWQSVPTKKKHHKQYNTLKLTPAK